MAVLVINSSLKSRHTCVNMLANIMDWSGKGFHNVAKKSGKMIDIFVLLIYGYEDRTI